MSRKPVSSQTRFSVLSRDRFTCRYCSRTAPEVELQVDHVKAVANGGTNEIDNLVTACVDCNQGKSDKDVPFVPEAASRAKGRPRHPLVGYALLSFVSGKCCEQGLIIEVVDDPAGALAMVQFFEWMVGEPTYCRLLPVASLSFDEGGETGRKSYRLFTSNDERNSYYEWKSGKFEGEAR